LMAHAPTENWRKITRDDRVKDQSGHARPGRGRIGQPCWNWGGRVREWQVRRTGIFVASPFKNGQSSGRSDIVGNADGICHPDGAVSLAHRMGEGGRRPGEGCQFWASTNMPRLRTKNG